LPEIRKFDSDIFKLEARLRGEGYQFGRHLRHALVHKVEGFSDLRKKFWSYKTKILHGRSMEESYGATYGNPRWDRTNATEELRAMIGSYLKRGEFRQPYNVVTYPQAYNLVARMFEEAECQVDRMPRQEKRDVA